MLKLCRFEISDRRIRLFDISNISELLFDRTGSIWVASLLVHVDGFAFKVLSKTLSFRKRENCAVMKGTSRAVLQ